MTFVSTKSFVSLSGGRQPIVGTNPMAFAFPRLPPMENKPLVFDQVRVAVLLGSVVSTANVPLVRVTIRRQVRWPEERYPFVAATTNNCHPVWQLTASEW